MDKYHITHISQCLLRTYSKFYHIHIFLRVYCAIVFAYLAPPCGGWAGVVVIIVRDTLWPTAKRHDRIVWHGLSRQLSKAHPSTRIRIYVYVCMWMWDAYNSLHFCAICFWFFISFHHEFMWRISARCSAVRATNHATQTTHIPFRKARAICASLLIVSLRQKFIIA